MRLLGAVLLALVLSLAAASAASAAPSGLRFDGVDDYVQAGLDPTAAETSTARTWEGWVRTDSAAYQTILNRYVPATGRAPWVLYIDGGTPVITIQENSYASARQSSVHVDDGAWHHVAAVWEPGVRLDLYVDGQLANGPLTGLDAIASRIDAAADIAVRLGVSHVNGADYGHFDGQLDGLRYSTGTRYSAPFTPADEPTADASTIGLWNFGEGSGTTTATEGAMTGPAELVNGPAWPEGQPAAPCTPTSALSLGGGRAHVDAGADPTARRTSEARTWDAWVRTTSTRSQVVTGRYAQGNGKAPWILALDNGRPQIAVQGGRRIALRSSTADVADGEWHHVAAVWEPGTRLDLYVDGERANGSLMGTLPASVDEARGALLRIGILSTQGSGSGGFDGQLDDVRYSLGSRYTGSSFSPATGPAPDAATIGLWSFAEGTGTATASQGWMTGTARLRYGATWAVVACADPDPDPDPEPVPPPGPVPAGDTLLFDGVDDFVQAGLDPTAPETTTARTWEAWVRTGSSGYQAILNRYVHATGRAPWVLFVDRGLPNITIQQNSYESARAATVRVDDGAWHHVAAVWEPDVRLDLYVDGQLANGPLTGRAGVNGIVVGTIDAAADVPVRLGVSHYNGLEYGYFNGQLDGLRYSSGARYSDTFTPAGEPAADGDTIGLWNLGEGYGTVTATEGLMTEPAQLLGGAGWAPR